MGLGRRVLVLVLVVGSGALADAADEEAPKFNICNDVGETTDLPRLQVGQCFNDDGVSLANTPLIQNHFPLLLFSEDIFVSLMVFPGTCDVVAQTIAATRFIVVP